MLCCVIFIYSSSSYARVHRIIALYNPHNSSSFFFIKTARYCQRSTLHDGQLLCLLCNCIYSHHKNITKYSPRWKTGGLFPFFTDRRNLERGVVNSGFWPMGSRGTWTWYIWKCDKQTDGRSYFRFCTTTLLEYFASDYPFLRHGMKPRTLSW